MNLKKLFGHLPSYFTEYKPILQNTSFLRLLTAGIISNIGSRISYFTLLRKVYILSNGRITDLGFLTIVQILPRVLFGPVAGIISDKLPRKQIMMLSDVLNGLIIVNLIWVQDMQLVFVISFLASLVNTFREPSQSALEPNLVEKDQIILLNSFKASTNSLLQIIGTAVGGMTVGFLGVNKAFTLDAITFFISAFLIATIRITEKHIAIKTTKTRPGSAGQFLQDNWLEFKKGVDIVWNKVNIRMVFLIDIFLSLSMGMQGTLIYYFLKQTMQLGDQAEKVWGFLLSSLGVGGVLGSFVLGAILKRYPKRFRIFLNVLLFDAVFFTLFLLNRYLPLSYVLFGTLGAIGAAFGILINSILQEEVDDSNRGKVFSLMGVIHGPASILSISLGTIGAAAITAVNILLLSACFEAMIAIGLRFTKTYCNAEPETGEVANVSTEN